MTLAKQFGSIREHHCYPLDYSRNDVPTESPNTSGFEPLAASMMATMQCRLYSLQATKIRWST